ncbi:hypothetical protein Tco_1015641 [Tanacetum coccineum]|uniref:Uncharacterized protein n=1 Tax=Tanacetum coccineum TaxID=301880 RepID=A0ABQ5FLD1_9ASTR
MRGKMVVVGGCEGRAAAMAVTMECSRGDDDDGGRLSGGATGGVMEMMAMATMLMGAAVVRVEMEMVELTRGGGVGDDVGVGCGYSSQGGGGCGWRVGGGGVVMAGI